MTTTKIVHIVDDDEAMRESLSFLLASVKFASRLYESAQALLARAHELEPGCILTDVRMPEMSGLELVVRVKELHLPHPVIVLTGHADVALAVEAMKAGVMDFLEKPFADEALLHAVRAALVHTNEATERGAGRSEVQARLDTLTEREREVFDAVVGGASNKQAAQQLGISPRTVEIYRAHVMQKMGADHLSALVRMAIRCGQA